MRKCIENVSRQDCPICLEVSSFPPLRSFGRAFTCDLALRPLLCFVRARTGHSHVPRWRSRPALRSPPAQVKHAFQSSHFPSSLRLFAALRAWLPCQNSVICNARRLWTNNERVFPFCSAHVVTPRSCFPFLAPVFRVTDTTLCSPPALWIYCPSIGRFGREAFFPLASALLIL